MGTDPHSGSGPTDRNERVALSERVRALERAISDSDDPPSPVPAVSEVGSNLDALTDRVDALEASVGELDARQQAVEAYVDRIEHVNDTIERRADAALAAVDRLESATRREPHTSSGSESTETGQHGERARQRGTDAPAEPHATNSTGGVGSSHVADAASSNPGGYKESDGSGLDSGEPAQGLFARLFGR